MSKVKIGNKVKDFKLPATGDKTIKLSELKDKKVVLYFYPKDSTRAVQLNHATCVIIMMI